MLQLDNRKVNKTLMAYRYGGKTHESLEHRNKSWMIRSSCSSSLKSKMSE